MSGNSGLRILETLQKSLRQCQNPCSSTLILVSVSEFLQQYQKSCNSTRILVAVSEVAVPENKYVCSLHTTTVRMKFLRFISTSECLPVIRDRFYSNYSLSLSGFSERFLIELSQFKIVLLSPMLGYVHLLGHQLHNHKERNYFNNVGLPKIEVPFS